MEIREEKPPKATRRINFPELLDLKPGQCAVYDMEDYRKVQSSVSYLRKRHGIEYITRTDPAAQEIKVWLKNQSTKKEK